MAFAEGLVPLLKQELESRPSVSIRFPASTASVEDAYQAPGNRLFYLIQDAHTNESGQLNLSKALSLILDKEKDLKYVFTEAGVGDNSLSFLREKSSGQEREAIARSYIKKGYLHGAEYLDLTSKQDFTLWGVEDLGLYSKALEDYRQVAKERERLALYLKKIETTVETLKNRLLNPSLAIFSKERKEYREEKLALTSYFNALMREAEVQNISLAAYPHLALLRGLKEKEEAIDFTKADAEHQKAFGSLSREDRSELKELADIQNKTGKVLQGHQDAQAYFFALQEKLGEKKSAYPELIKYFTYLKSAREVEAKEVLKEVDALEKDILGVLVRTQDEKDLLQCESILFYLNKLFLFTMTPEEYLAYKEQSRDFSIEAVTGFLNKKIMDLGAYYERSLFLEDGYDGVLRHAENFYEITKARDEHFLKEAFGKMEKENASKAVLITGGFHTADLKSLLKAKGISYISVTPQVWQETNLKKYESVLLGQNLKALQPASVPMKAASMMVLDAMTDRAGWGANLVSDISAAAPQDAGARLAKEPAKLHVVREAPEEERPVTAVIAMVLLAAGFIGVIALADYFIHHPPESALQFIQQIDDEFKHRSGLPNLSGARLAGGSDTEEVRRVILEHSQEVELLRSHGFSEIEAFRILNNVGFVFSRASWGTIGEDVRVRFRRELLDTVRRDDFQSLPLNAAVIRQYAVNRINERFGEGTAGTTFPLVSAQEQAKRRRNVFIAVGSAIFLALAAIFGHVYDRYQKHVEDTARIAAAEQALQNFRPGPHHRVLGAALDSAHVLRAMLFDTAGKPLRSGDEVRVTLTNTRTRQLNYFFAEMSGESWVVHIPDGQSYPGDTYVLFEAQRGSMPDFEPRVLNLTVEERSGARLAEVKVPNDIQETFKQQGFSFDRLSLRRVEVDEKTGRASLVPASPAEGIDSTPVKAGIAVSILQALAGSAHAGTLGQTMGRKTKESGGDYGKIVDSAAVVIGKKAMETLAKALDITIIIGGNEGSFRDESADLKVGMVINPGAKNGSYFYFGDSVEVTNGVKRLVGRPGTSSMIMLVPAPMMPSTDGYRISLAVDKFNPSASFPKIDPIITSTNTLKHVLTQIANYMGHSSETEVDAFIRKMASEYNIATLNRPKHDQLNAQAKELGFSVVDREDGDPILFTRAMLGIKGADGKKLFTISTGGANEHIMAMAFASLYGKALMVSTYASTETLKQVDKDHKGTGQGSLDRANDFTEGDMAQFHEVNRGVADLDSSRKLISYGPTTLQQAVEQVLNPRSKELYSVITGPAALVITSNTGANEMDWGELSQEMKPVTWKIGADGKGTVSVSGFFIANDGHTYFYDAGLTASDATEARYGLVAANIHMAEKEFQNPLFALYDKMRAPLKESIRAGSVEPEVIYEYASFVTDTLSEESGMSDLIHQVNDASRRALGSKDYSELSKVVKAVDEHFLGSPSVTMEDGSVHQIVQKTGARLASARELGTRAAAGGAWTLSFGAIYLYVFGAAFAGYVAIASVIIFLSMFIISSPNWTNFPESVSGLLMSSGAASAIGLVVTVGWYTTMYGLVGAAAFWAAAVAGGVLIVLAVLDRLPAGNGLSALISSPLKTVGGAAAAIFAGAILITLEFPVWTVAVVATAAWLTVTGKLFIFLEGWSHLWSGGRRAVVIDGHWIASKLPTAREEWYVRAGSSLMRLVSPFILLSYLTVSLRNYPTVTYQTDGDGYKNMVISTEASGARLAKGDENAKERLNRTKHLIAEDVVSDLRGAVLILRELQNKAMASDGMEAARPYRGLANKLAMEMNRMDRLDKGRTYTVGAVKNLWQMTIEVLREHPLMRPDAAFDKKEEVRRFIVAAADDLALLLPSQAHQPKDLHLTRAKDSRFLLPDAAEDEVVYYLTIGWDVVLEAHGNETILKPHESKAVDAIDEWMEARKAENDNGGPFFDVLFDEDRHAMVVTLSIESPKMGAEAGARLAARDLSKTVVLFPPASNPVANAGQALYEKYDYVRDIYARVNAAARSVFKESDPSFDVQTTETTVGTHVASLAYEMALWEVYKREALKGVQPDSLMGISRGSIAAFYAAGAIDLELAVELMIKNMQFLEKASMDAGERRMGVVWMKEEALLPILAAHKGVVTIRITDRQFIFSAPASELEAIDVEIRQARGRYMPSVVTVASHDPNLVFVNGVDGEKTKDARDFESYLREDAGKRMHAPQIPLYSSVTGRRLLTTGDLVEEALRFPHEPIQLSKTLPVFQADRGILDFVMLGGPDFLVPGQKRSGLLDDGTVSTAVFSDGDILSFASGARLAAYEYEERAIESAADEAAAYFSSLSDNQKPRFLVELGDSRTELTLTVYQKLKKTLSRERLNDLYIVVADPDAQSRNAAYDTLIKAGISKNRILRLYADISKPEAFQYQLAKRFRSLKLRFTTDDGLYMTSMAIHRRPLQAPFHPAWINQIEKEEVRHIESQHNWVGQDGRVLPNAWLQRNLIGLLAGWARVSPKHGMLVVEHHTPEKDIPREGQAVEFPVYSDAALRANARVLSQAKFPAGAADGEVTESATLFKFLSVPAVASQIKDSYDRYIAHVYAINDRAAERFINRDVSGIEDDQAELVVLFAKYLDEIREWMRAELGERLYDMQFWDGLEAYYLHRSVNHEYDRGLAKKFFDALMGRVYAEVPGHSFLEFGDDGIEGPGPVYSSSQVPYRIHRRTGTTEQMVRELFGGLPFRKAISQENLDKAIAQTARRFEERFGKGPMKDALKNGRIEILSDHPFYRNKGVYIMGLLKSANGKAVAPIILAFNNQPKNGGIRLHAVLTDFKIANHLFHSSRTNFRVPGLQGHYREILDFLWQVIPDRDVAVVYSSIGFVYPSKMRFLKRLRDYVKPSMEFEKTSGREGTLMLTMKLKGFPFIFKIIRESALEQEGAPLKGLGNPHALVTEKYREADKRNRVGRKLGAMKFYRIAFKAQNFSDDILNDFRTQFKDHVQFVPDPETGEETVLIKDLYVQSEVIPLDVYLKDPKITPQEEFRVMKDYVQALIELAQAGIFQSDPKVQNFGVTPDGRVVSFDNDDMLPVEDLGYIQMHSDVRGSVMKPSSKETTVQNRYKDPDYIDANPEYARFKVADRDLVVVTDYNLFTHIVDRLYHFLGNPALDQTEVKALIELFKNTLEKAEFWEEIKRGLITKHDIPEFFPYPPTEWAEPPANSIADSELPVSRLIDVDAHGKFQTAGLPIILIVDHDPAMRRYYVEDILTQLGEGRSLRDFQVVQVEELPDALLAMETAKKAGLPLYMVSSAFVADPRKGGISWEASGAALHQAASEAGYPALFIAGEKPDYVEEGRFIKRTGNGHTRASDRIPPETLITALQNILAVPTGARLASQMPTTLENIRKRVEELLADKEPEQAADLILKAISSKKYGITFKDVDEWAARFTDHRHYDDKAAEIISAALLSGIQGFDRAYIEQAIELQLTAGNLSSAAGIILAALSEKKYGWTAADVTGWMTRTAAKGRYDIVEKLLLASMKNGLDGIEPKEFEGWIDKLIQNHWQHSAARVITAAWEGKKYGMTAAIAAKYKSFLEKTGEKGAAARIPSRLKNASGARLAGKIFAVDDPAGKIVQVSQANDPSNPLVFFKMVSRDRNEWAVEVVDGEDVLRSSRHTVSPGHMLRLPDFEIILETDPMDSSKILVEAPEEHTVSVVTAMSEPASEGIERVETPADVLKLIGIVGDWLKEHEYPDSDVFEVYREYISKAGRLTLDKSPVQLRKTIALDGIRFEWNPDRINEIISATKDDPAQSHLVAKLAALLVADAWGYQAMLQLNKDKRMGDPVSVKIIHTYEISKAVDFLKWASAPERAAYDPADASKPGATAYETMFLRNLGDRDIFVQITEGLVGSKQKARDLWYPGVQRTLQQIEKNIIRTASGARLAVSGDTLEKAAKLLDLAALKLTTPRDRAVKANRGRGSAFFLTARINKATELAHKLKAKPAPEEIAKIVVAIESEIRTLKRAHRAPFAREMGQAAELLRTNTAQAGARLAAAVAATEEVSSQVRRFLAEVGFDMPVAAGRIALADESRAVRVYRLERDKDSLLVEVETAEGTRQFTLNKDQDIEAVKAGEQVSEAQLDTRLTAALDEAIEKNSARSPASILTTPKKIILHLDRIENIQNKHVLSSLLFHWNSRASDSTRIVLEGDESLADKAIELAQTMGLRKNLFVRADKVPADYAKAPESHLLTEGRLDEALKAKYPGAKWLFLEQSQGQARFFAFAPIEGLLELVAAGQTDAAYEFFRTITGHDLSKEQFLLLLAGDAQMAEKFPLTFLNKVDLDLVLRLYQMSKVSDLSA